MWFMEEYADHVSYYERGDDSNSWPNNNGKRLTIAEFEKSDLRKENIQIQLKC